MKQNVRKALAISGMAVIIGTTGMTYYANAKVLESKKANFSNEKRFNEDKSGRKLKSRTIPGKVVALNENSLEIRKGNTLYEVELGNQISLIDKQKNAIAFNEIKTGHRLRIRGILLGKKITASQIRDVSLPSDTNI